SVELAVGAQDEDAVDAAGEEAVDEPLEPGQVKVFVGLHRCGDRGDDALDAHGNPRKTWAIGCYNLLPPRPRHVYDYPSPIPGGNADEASRALGSGRAVGRRAGGVGPDRQGTGR